MVKFSTETISFSSGFVLDSTKMSLIGQAKIASNTLQLSSGLLNQAGVFWWKADQNIGNGFTAKFTATLSSIASGYGFAFVLQRSGPLSSGFSGTGLGYRGITPSFVAVRFERISSGVYTANSATTLFNIIVETQSGVIATAPVWGRM